MKIITRTNMDIATAEKYFISKNRPYKISSTNYSIMICNDLEGWIISKYYSGFGLLKLIQKVRSDVNKNIEGLELTEKPIKYFGFNEMQFQQESGSIVGIEVDLSKAYLYSAYYQKFISEDIFQRLLEVKKTTRLKVLGSLAVKKDIIYYDNLGKYISREKIKNNKHCIVWNNICQQVDEYIQLLIQVNKAHNFIFYWFDNLFLRIKESNFNPINKKFILKISSELLNYKWTHLNLLQLEINNRIFNFRKDY